MCLEDLTVIDHCLNLVVTIKLGAGTSFGILFLRNRIIWWNSVRAARYTVCTSCQFLKGHFRILVLVQDAVISIRGLGNFILSWLLKVFFVSFKQFANFCLIICLKTYQSCDGCYQQFVFSCEMESRILKGSTQSSDCCLVIILDPNQDCELNPRRKKVSRSIASPILNCLLPFLFWGQVRGNEGLI